MITLFEMGSFFFSKVKASFLCFWEFFKLCNERVESLSIGEPHLLIVIGDNLTFHTFQLFLLFLILGGAHGTADDFRLDQVFLELFVDFLEFFTAHSMIV